MIETILRDAVFGFRMLRGRPVFTLISAITLALGIGANSAIFSIINTVLIRPLPYENANQLVMLWRSKEKSLLSPGQYMDIRSQNRVFQDVAAYKDSATSQDAQFDLSGDSLPLRVSGACVSVNLFSLLGVHAEIGRTFEPDEEMPGHERVVILSEGLWRDYFGADRGLIGKAINLDSRKYIVVGVMPAEFKLSYPKKAALWVPLVFEAKDHNNRGEIAFKIIGRLKPEVTFKQSQTAMRRLSATLAEQHPATDHTDIYVTPLVEEVTGSSGPALLLLFGAVGLVLLIACVNVANLQIAQTSERTKELSVRAALGASRRTLVQQLLIENIILSLIGGVGGLLLGISGGAILARIGPADLPRLDEFTVDYRLLGFTLLISVATVVLFGTMPAIRASKPDLTNSLKEIGMKATVNQRSDRTRGALMVSQIALALVLLIGSGLMINSLWHLNNVNLGFSAQNILTVKITLPYAKYYDNNRQIAFYQQLTEKTRALPGVKQVSIANAVPLNGTDYMMTFLLKDDPSLSGEHQSARCRMIGPEYFDSLGIAVRRGRAFTERDISVSPPVAIINHALAQRYFPGEDPIGKHLTLYSDTEIVGLVSDVRQNRVDQPAEPAIYIPISQRPSTRLAMIVKTDVDSESLASAIKKDVWEIDRVLPVESISTMENIIETSAGDKRFYIWILTAFAGLATTLAAVGIYGVISYSVSQRTHEIGIRAALGASPGDLLKMIIGHNLVFFMIGIGAGLIIALLLARLLSSFLYEVTANDPLTFLFCALFLSLIAMIASYLPASKAIKLNPLSLLRQG